MIEVFTLWRHTRMVVLVALIAGLYAAILIPFKAIPIIPGFTEMRPANVVPVVCSLLFGPAAAWGSAFGNLIGDVFGGTFGLGSIPGFFGNFLYGYLPYKVFEQALPLLSRFRRQVRGLGLAVVALGVIALLAHVALWAVGVPLPGPPMHLAGRIALLILLPLAALVGWLCYARGPRTLAFVAAALAASGACGLFIGWGVDLLGLVPFAALGNIILLNNFIASAILGPPLMAALYPRVKRWGLVYADMLEDRDRSKGRLAPAAAIVLWVALIWGMVAGNIASLGVGGALLKFGAGHAGSATVAWAAAPAVALLWLASLLL
jgi:energy-coupling factor transport system substrate-specific component